MKFFGCQVDTFNQQSAESVPTIPQRKLQSLHNTTRLEGQENVYINLIRIFGFLMYPFIDTMKYFQRNLRVDYIIMLC